MMDLFGKEVMLFQQDEKDAASTSAAGSGSKMAANVSVLKGVVEGGDKERRKRILVALKDNLIQVSVFLSSILRRRAF